jgi:hypothetical protein
MTFLSPVGGAMPRPSAILSRQVLDMEVQVRRARLAELEAEMIAACEAAARGARPRTSAGFEREHWDRATWHRYLAAAMRLKAEFGPAHAPPSPGNRPTRTADHIADRRLSGCRGGLV